MVGNDKTDTACENICSKREVPAEDELEALNAMRSIKDRVRALKRRMDEISASKEEGHRKETKRLEEEMTRLKEEWDHWNRKREEAAKVRMIMLGHEPVS